MSETFRFIFRFPQNFFIHFSAKNLFSIFSGLIFWPQKKKIVFSRPLLYIYNSEAHFGIAKTTVSICFNQFMYKTCRYSRKCKLFNKLE